MGLAQEDAETLANKVYRKEEIRKKIKSLEFLAIDEVSMISDELFDKINKIFQRIHNNSDPF
jgi:hypothetical protein